MSRSETAKNAGSLWLEYHFGWEPLVKDIHDTIMFLDGDFPAGLVRSKSVRRGSLTVNMKGGTNLEVQFYTGSSMRAKVSLTNPMLHVANSMGVINPLTILWEVVPFSFVVDWFIPIGSYLNSYTDYFGIELIHGSKTRKSWARGKQWVTDSNGAVTSRQGTVEAVCIDRSLGIPSAKFPRFKSFKGFSPVRGATAVALLLQTLASERRYFNQRAGNRRK